MQNIHGLAHFGLYVRDMEASKQFYTEVLGFECTFETTGTPHLCFVQNGDCVIELIKSDAECVDGHFNHLCLKVQDIDAAVAQLAAHGVTPEFPVREMPQVFNGIKMTFFRGPDGERIEFNQFL